MSGKPKSPTYQRDRQVRIEQKRLEARLAKTPAQMVEKAREILMQELTHKKAGSKGKTSTVKLDALGNIFGKQCMFALLLEEMEKRHLERQT